MYLSSHWLFPHVPALMREHILEISVILETRTEEFCSLYCSAEEESASPTHSSHFIRMSCFHAMHLIHVATIIYKLIKPDELLLGKRGSERERDRCRERQYEGLYSEQSPDN